MKKRFQYIFLMLQILVGSVCFPFPLGALTTGELIIENQSSDILKIVVFPIDAIFNGDKMYTLKSKLYDNWKLKVEN